MFNLLDGGVCKKENSFKPEKIKFIVRGIGVADKYSMWIFSCLLFIMSFCLIPNLCSSSTIKIPVFVKSIPHVNRAWVPIIISIVLLLKYIDFKWPNW